MSTASTRAQAIAHILWDLKKSEKLATLTSIAAQAGFSPGANGRTVSTTLKTVRRDWPHLQWWRAVADNGQFDEEQQSYLAQAGFKVLNHYYRPAGQPRDQQPWLAVISQRKED